MSLEILPTEEEIFCTHKNRIKKGFRNNKSGKKQRFICKDCGHKFIEGNDLRFKADKRIVSRAVKLSQRVSTRQIAKDLKKKYNVVVSHVAVFKWIRKYPNLISEDPYVLCKKQGLNYLEIRNLTTTLILRGELCMFGEENKTYLQFIEENFYGLCKRMGMTKIPENIEYYHQGEMYILKIK